MKCPNCNSENEEGNLFCELCGTKLTAAVSRPARTSILKGSLAEMEAAMEARLDALMNGNKNEDEPEMEENYNTDVDLNKVHIIKVNGDEYEVSFWAKDLTQKKDGKYTDYIALIRNTDSYDYFIAEPSGVFTAVYVDWDSENEEIDDDERNEKIKKYVMGYHNHGTQITINEIYFESDNGYSTEEELADLIILCSDDSSDHDDGCELLMFDEDYFDDDYCC